MSRLDPAPPPVAIGGIGGSGTRLIAQLLVELGFYLGDDLGTANDNLWFTLLFKRRALLTSEHAEAEFARALDIFSAVMTGRATLSAADESWVRSLARQDRPQHPAAWLSERAESLLQAARRAEPRSGAWGWKEPNTHIVLDRLIAALPGLRYIHVIRNGLDMAYSDNQNQLEFWGADYLGDDALELNPRNSLKYWSRVHQRVEALGRQLPGRYLLLNYDDFCADPQRGLQALAPFLGVALSPAQVVSLSALVKPPGSRGRFKAHGLQDFDPEDVAYAGRLGFDTAPDPPAA